MALGWILESLNKTSTSKHTENVCMQTNMPSRKKNNTLMQSSPEQFTTWGPACLDIELWCISCFFSLVLPLLCREMVEVLDKGDSVVNHTSLSNYAFLYGVFPVAPGVAIFATQFNMEVEIVCIPHILSLIVRVVGRKWIFKKQKSAFFYENLMSISYFMVYIYKEASCDII